MESFLILDLSFFYFFLLQLILIPALFFFVSWQFPFLFPYNVHVVMEARKFILEFHFLSFNYFMTQFCCNNFSSKIKKKFYNCLYGICFHHTESIWKSNIESNKYDDDNFETNEKRKRIDSLSLPLSLSSYISLSP